MRLQTWKQLDFMMLAAALALLVAGVALVHSATCGHPCPGLFPPSSWATRQALYVLIGLMALGLLASIDYRLIGMAAYYLYGLLLVLLSLVLLVGGSQEASGVRRWFDLGVLDFQPSEIGKLILIIALARFLADRPEGPPRLGRILASAIMVMAPAGLVFSQPDLGTALVYLIIWFAMLVGAGASRSQLGLICASAVAAAPLIWLVMQDYMRARLASFFGALVDINSDPFGEGYNILQARITIGSGSLFGKGYLDGTQTQLDYLRVQHTDFIFSVLAEELGFFGALAVLVLMLVILLRALRVADRAADDFGRLIAFGVTAMVAFQAFSNLGANLTLLPVSGLPLPLLSYGGSALAANLAAIGILQSILARRLKYRY